MFKDAKRTNFVVGDRVKILPSATRVSVESEDVGKVGVIKYIRGSVSKNWGIMVQMNEICVARGCVPTWSVGHEMLELIPAKNEQLEFDFMKE